MSNGETSLTRNHFRYLPGILQWHLELSARCVALKLFSGARPINNLLVSSLEMYREQ